MFDFLLEDLDGIDKRKNRHLDNLTNLIAGSLKETGCKVEKETKIKNSFYGKRCDLFCSFPNGSSSIVELKSISSSFGKNFNNRIEELVGQATLWRNVLSANKIGYVFVFHDEHGKYERYCDRLNEALKYFKSEKILDDFLLLKISEGCVSLCSDNDLQRFCDSLAH
jgi:hypothetical protein